MSEWADMRAALMGPPPEHLDLAIAYLCGPFTPVGKLATALADLERAKAAFRDATQAGRDLPPEAEFGRLEDAYFTGHDAFLAALDQVTGGLAKRISEALA